MSHPHSGRMLHDHPAGVDTLSGNSKLVPEGNLLEQIPFLKREKLFFLCWHVIVSDFSWQKVEKHLLDKNGTFANFSEYVYF